MKNLNEQLDALLAAHDELITSMLSGRAVSHAPSRLRKINARIHAAYSSLAMSHGPYLQVAQSSGSAATDEDFHSHQ